MMNERYHKSNETKVDTQLNYTHIGLFVTTIFAMGVGYGSMNAKIDKVLATVIKYDNLELRTTQIERQEQTQEYINKNLNDRFLRDEEDIKKYQEQKPFSHTQN